MKNVKKILFVCTGNSCRSIMAEAYLKNKFAKENISIEVRSAGTLGMGGLSPTEETLKVLMEEGISPEGYESKTLTEEFIRWADIILVMEPAHKVKVLTLVPEAEEKIYYLGQFNDNEKEVIIPDPIGKPLDFYKESLRIIKQSIEGFMEWLKK